MKVHRVDLKYPSLNLTLFSPFHIQEEFGEQRLLAALPDILKILPKVRGVAYGWRVLVRTWQQSILFVLWGPVVSLWPKKGDSGIARAMKRTKKCLCRRSFCFCPSGVMCVPRTMFS